MWFYTIVCSYSEIYFRSLIYFMKTNKLFLSFLILFLSSIFIINCKRDLKSSTVNLSEATLKMIKENGKTFTIPVNESVKGFAADAEGNKLVQNKNLKARLLTDPTLCEDPTLAEPDDVTLVSIEKKYTCGYGYELTIHWRISSLFTLKEANPENSAQLSKGRTRLKTGTSTVLYSNTSITPVHLVVVGQDSYNPAKTVYELTYTTPFISAAQMSSAATIDNSYLLYTDCGAGNTVSVPYLSTFSFLASEITDPCKRVDRIVVGSGGAPYNYNGYLAGSDVVGTCSTDGYKINTGSFVEYRLQGTSDWYPMPMYDSQGNLRTTGIIYFWEIMYTKSSDLQGTYEVRYRNTYGTPNSCTSAPVSQTFVITYY
jgi:hypothetical protein